MTWISPKAAPFEGPMTGDDRAILEGYLAQQRATVLRICAGLSGEQLAVRAVPPSTLSLLGIVRHLTKVERIWLRIRVGGETVPHLHGGPGDPADFDGTDPARAEQEMQALHEEWRRADTAVATVPFTHEIDFRGDPMSVRMVYVHMIGEYARHNGHADLLRQVIDGVTGR